MVKLEINLDEEKHTFDIPEGWDEITVEKFQEIMEVQENKDITNIERLIAVIHIIIGIPKDLVMLLPVDEFNRISDIIKFTNEDITNDVKESILIDDEEYFIKKDFDNLTMGELISIEMLVEQTGGNIFKALDKLMCIFLRKKKENGKLETFKTDMLERAERFKLVPISEIYQLMVFFSDGRASLDNSIVDSSGKA